MSNEFIEKFKIFLTSKQAVWLIICFGCILRLAQYLYNRSLWLDEAFLASSFTTRSLAGLFDPLDYHQLAPFGFLAAVKFFVMIFGNSEHALRLFPLLCGIISVPLFYKAANKYINSKAVLISTALFAVSGYRSAQLTHSL